MSSMTDCATILPSMTLVKKKSGKPFKDGKKIAVVHSVIEHPHLPDKLAYVFVGHDGYVRTDYCIPAQ